MGAALLSWESHESDCIHPRWMLCRRMMKLGDLIVALDINCGTYVPHTKRDEEGLMTFAMEGDAS